MWYSPGFTVKLLFLHPHFHIVLCKELLLCAAHTWVEYITPPGGQNVYINSILHERFDSSPHSLFNHLFISAWLLDIYWYFEFYSLTTLLFKLSQLWSLGAFSVAPVSSLSHFQQCVKCSNWFWLKLLWGEFNKWDSYKGEIRAEGHYKGGLMDRLYSPWAGHELHLFPDPDKLPW